VDFPSCALACGPNSAKSGQKRRSQGEKGRKFPLRHLHQKKIPLEDALLIAEFTLFPLTGVFLIAKIPPFPLGGALISSKFSRSPLSRCRSSPRNRFHLPRQRQEVKRKNTHFYELLQLRSKIAFLVALFPCSWGSSCSRFSTGRPLSSENSPDVCSLSSRISLFVKRNQ
jgi:hypothetical protein